MSTADIDRELIRDIFIKHGFTIKDGYTDLKPYVYAAADDLIALACFAQPGQATNADVHTLRRLIECAEKLNERPRPLCRDCADENGTCPNSGLECDMRKLFADAKALHNRLAVPASTAATQPDHALTAAVDAAMVEMANISPPLRRSECARLIRAALAIPASTARIQIAPSMSDAELGHLADAFAAEADADSDAELRAGGPKRLIAFDYYKRGHLAGRQESTAASERRIKQLELLVQAYGPKSLQYDIEHPNDGLNGDAASVQQAEKGCYCGGWIAADGEGFHNVGCPAESEQQAGAVNHSANLYGCIEQLAGQLRAVHPNNMALDRADELLKNRAALTHRAITATPNHRQLADALRELLRDYEAKVECADSARDARNLLERLDDAATPDIATTAADQQACDDARAGMRDAIAEALSNVYYCGRAWSAWGVGTMSEDDFTPAAEVDEVLDGLTDAAIAAMADKDGAQ